MAAEVQKLAELLIASSWVVHRWSELCFNSGNFLVQLWGYKSISPLLLPSEIQHHRWEICTCYHFIYCSLTKKAISKMLTPKTLTSTPIRMKFQQDLLHFCEKLCHSIHRLIHSLEFQAHTRCDPTSLYSLMLCLVHVFTGFSTARK